MVSSDRAKPSLDRRDAVRALLADRGDMLVVAGLGAPTYDVYAAGDHDGNFYLWGAMGGAALVGLGLALAQPGRPVSVLTGDGEQLMGLGGLATIAVSAPANLTVVVLDNGRFGETGGQLSHSGLGVDLGAVARAVGFRQVLDVDTEDGLGAARKAMGSVADGPRFVTVRIDSDEKARALPTRDGPFLTSRLRTHIGFPVR